MEGRIIDYTLVQEMNYDKFIDTVNGNIEEGWEPFGSIQIKTVRGTGYTLYYQPMVKRERKES